MRDWEASESAPKVSSSGRRDYLYFNTIYCNCKTIIFWYAIQLVIFLYSFMALVFTVEFRGSFLGFMIRCIFSELSKACEIYHFSTVFN